jgi:hypothetical protein
MTSCMLNLCSITVLSPHPSCPTFYWGCISFWLAKRSPVWYRRECHVGWDCAVFSLSSSIC